MEAGSRQCEAVKIIGLSERTFERWKAVPTVPDGRLTAERTPANRLTDDEKKTILKIANSPEYKDLPPCQIVPRLADEGRYVASESSFYRVLKTVDQMQHRTRSKPRVHKAPNELKATRPNQVWTWDITYLKSCVKGVYFYLYMHVDIFSRKIVGWAVHDAENTEYAAELFSKLCINEKVNPQSLHLHSDNGSPMKGSTMLATLQMLGVVPSFSRPSVSNDNPFSEALFKTLKYHQSYPEGAFDSIDDARLWVETFVAWYNNEHLHSSIGFVTPNQRNSGADIDILSKRKKLYEKAKRKNPLRWSRNTRTWQRENDVVLNPKPHQDGIKRSA